MILEVRVVWAHLRITVFFAFKVLTDKNRWVTKAIFRLANLWPSRESTNCQLIATVRILANREEAFRMATFLTWILRTRTRKRISIKLATPLQLATSSKQAKQGPKPSLQLTASKRAKKMFQLWDDHPIYKFYRIAWTMRTPGMRRKTKFYSTNCWSATNCVSSNQWSQLKRTMPVMSAGQARKISVSKPIRAIPT